MKRLYFILTPFIVAFIVLRSYFVVQQQPLYYLIVNLLLLFSVAILVVKTDNLIISLIGSLMIPQIILFEVYNFLLYIGVHRDFCLFIGIFCCYGMAFFLIAYLVFCLSRLIAFIFYKTKSTATVMSLQRNKSLFTLRGRYDVVFLTLGNDYVYRNSIYLPLKLKEDMVVETLLNKKGKFITRNDKRMFLCKAICVLICLCFYVLQAFLYTSLLV